MSLQKKIVFVFLCLGFVFAIGTYAGLRSVISPTFEEFERESAEQNLSRIRNAMAAELTALDIVNREYSEWDHTYDFMLGQRDQYVEENLHIPYLESIGVNLMVFVDLSGQILWGAMVDETYAVELSIEEEFGHPISIEQFLLPRSGDVAELNGLLHARTAPLLISSLPIVNSAGDRPSAGVFIMAKFLDENLVAAIADRAGVDVTLYDTNDAATPHRILSLVDRLADLPSSTHWEHTEDFVTTNEVLDDIYGTPSFLLEVKTPKTITEIGSNTVDAAMLFLLAATAIFLLVAWIFMRRLIVGPVATLTQHILKIRKTGDLDQKLETDRKDEIGLLAKEFGQLARKLSMAQKELEAARDQAVAVSQAKSEFLARMSHEIRTPMNGVLGMIELLNTTPLEDTQKRYAQTIYESADSLLDIINDVLDFSKMEAGRLRLEQINFDLNAFLSDTAESLENLAHQKGLSLECEHPEGPALAVRGDPFRLRQILTNLIGNAIKFTETGSVSLRATVADDDAEYKFIRFDVIDTGIGIAHEKRKIIFDSFAQEDGSTTRRFGGTGLGLAISKQLVEMMDGDLSVVSEPGQGSEFSFTLRMRSSSGSEFSTSARLLQRGAFKPKENSITIRPLQGRVLLGEDNAVNQEVALGMLSAMGVEVVVAKNGNEVVEQFSSDSFDIVLMDCQMPILDGFQATQAIRKIESTENLKPVRIVAVTANALAGDKDICISSGMNDYLSKPFTSEQLYRILSRNLNPGKAGPAQESDRNAEQAVGATGSQPTLAAIDAGVLDGLSTLPQSENQDLVDRVIAAYLSSSAELMESLYAAMDSGDASSVRASAHALKSSSANVGAIHFADLCKSMETKTREDDLEPALKLRHQIEEEYKRVIAELKLRLKANAA